MSFKPWEINAWIMKIKGTKIEILMAQRKLLCSHQITQLLISSPKLFY